MTNATDRRQIVELVNEARMAGARLQRICQELGIGLNTYRRWSTGTEDQRRHAVHPLPAHALTPEERQTILDTCHRPEFASLPPAVFVKVVVTVFCLKQLVASSSLFQGST